MSSMQALPDNAARVGLRIGIYNPGDGVIRYRFFIDGSVTGESPAKEGEYFAGEGEYTALGRKEAHQFVLFFHKGYRAGKEKRGEVPE